MQTRLIEFLKSTHDAVTKIYYFSDGCGGQYKNRKNFLNLCFHFTDFGILAEWHFFATSHGKNACDGVGGVVKRTAARCSLQRVMSADTILTPRQLYDFSVQSHPNMHFSYVTNDDYNVITGSELLKSRFEEAITVAGTLKLHSIIPSTTEVGVVEVRRFSADSNVREEHVLPISNVAKLIPITEIKGFVTAVYDKKWYLACVTNVCAEENCATLNFLTPPGPTKSFTFPRRKDELVVDVRDVLTVCSPSCPTGRTYYLTESEMQATSAALELRL